MKIATPILAGLLMGSPVLTASVATGAFAQQPAPSTQPAPQPQVRQRAPGVPMVPRADVARLREQNGDKERTDGDRTPPMPKGVPSIIAP